MSAQRTWLGRRKQILQILEKSTTDEIERPVIENLFEVQKRTALLMMKEIGPIERDHRWFIKRKDLIRWVQAIDESADIEDRRRQNTHDVLNLAIEEDRAVRVALAENGRPAQDFPLVQEILCSSLMNMPAGVSIEPGRITIEFPASDPLQVLESLYALGKALANDWEMFVMQQTTPGEAAPSLQRTASELPQPQHSY